MIDVISQISREDLPDMLRIWNKFTHVFTSAHNIHTLDSMEKWFDEQKESNRIFYGAYIEHQLKGFLVIQFQGPDIWIEMWAVDPAFQHMGFGAQLLQYVLSNHKIQGHAKAELKVDNFMVLNSLIKYGFTIVGYDKKLNEYFLKRK